MDEKKVKLGRSYLITIALLFCAGMIWAKINYEIRELRVIGVAIATIGCSIANLIYFIPVKRLSIRLLTPGIISTLVFILINQSSSSEQTFFIFFGVVNLLIGSMWLLLKNRNV